MFYFPGCGKLGKVGKNHDVNFWSYCEQPRNIIFARKLWYFALLACGEVLLVYVIQRL